MSNQDKSFWKVRSKDYKQLEWVTRQGYLASFVEAGDFRTTDNVLDVGTGTGIIAHTLAPMVKRVVGIDISPDMLAEARKKKPHNTKFIEADVRDTAFPVESFDKITARMVFHHIMTDIERAMSNCHAFLRPGGRMVLSEGVPPHPDLRDWYTTMFALKEERRTFLEDELVKLVEAAGFQRIQTTIHISPQMSIQNWLGKSGLPGETQAQIYQMHLNLDGLGRRHYNMRVTDDDILLDWKYVILAADRGE